MNLEGGMGWRLPSSNRPMRAGWAWAPYLSKDAVEWDRKIEYACHPWPVQKSCAAQDLRGEGDSGRWGLGHVRSGLGEEKH